MLLITTNRIEADIRQIYKPILLTLVSFLVLTILGDSLDFYDGTYERYGCLPMAEQIDAVLQGSFEHLRTLAETDEAQSVPACQSRFLLYRRIRQSPMFLLQLDGICLGTDR